MGDNFTVTGVLPELDAIREDWYDLMKTLAPTSELVHPDTMEISSGMIAALLGVFRYKKFTFDFAALSAAATSKSISIFTLPGGGVIDSVKIKHSNEFTGGGVTATTLSVGISGDLAKYAVAFDVFQAPGDTVFGFNSIVSAETHNPVGTPVVLTATSTTADLDQLDQGDVDVWIRYGATI